MPLTLFIITFQKQLFFISEKKSYFVTKLNFVSYIFHQILINNNLSLKGEEFNKRANIESTNPDETPQSNNDLSDTYEDTDYNGKNREDGDEITHKTDSNNPIDASKGLYIKYIFIYIYIK